MTDSKHELHLDDEIPASGTVEMSKMIHSIIQQLLEQLPFEFTTGNVMEACTMHVIDAGMVMVMDGKQTREQLKADITRVTGIAIDGWQAADSPLDYTQGRPLQ